MASIIARDESGARPREEFLFGIRSSCSACHFEAPTDISPKFYLSPSEKRQLKGTPAELACAVQQNAVDIATRIATIHSISQTLDRSLRHNQERYEKIRTILELIKKDGSGGMHNYRRTKALLRESEFELLYSGLQKYATDTYENMRENMKRYLSMKTAN